METISPAGNLYAKEVSFVKIMKKVGRPLESDPPYKSIQD